MLRLLELFLFLFPFGAFALWRVLAPARGPSPAFVAALAAVLALLAGGLIWYSRQEALPGNTVYAPAQFEHGRLVPGHGVPR